MHRTQRLSFSFLPTMSSRLGREEGAHTHTPSSILHPCRLSHPRGKKHRQDRGGKGGLSAEVASLQGSADAAAQTINTFFLPSMTTFWLPRRRCIAYNLTCEGENNTCDYNKKGGMEGKAALTRPRMYCHGHNNINVGASEGKVRRTHLGILYLLSLDRN